METESGLAWLIHKRDVGETSLQLYLFTAKRGLIRCRYKGGRAIKKKGLLQPFTPFWAVLQIYPNTIYAQQLEQEAPTIPLSNDALLSGLYINELLYRILQAESPQESLFAAYLTTLQGLSLTTKRQAIEPLLRRFEWQLLEASGTALSLNHDAKMLPIQPEIYYQFVEDAGLVQASEGFLGAHLLAMSQDKLETIEVLKTAKLLMRKALHALLGGMEIHARALFKT